MRRSALVLTLLLATNAVAKERSWVSALGAGLVTVSLGAAGLGVSQWMISTDARLAAEAYSTPSREEAPAVGLLETRAKSATTVSIASFIAAGTLLVGGVLCWVLDRPMPSVALVPSRDGVAFALSAEF